MIAVSREGGARRTDHRPGGRWICGSRRDGATIEAVPLPDDADAPDEAAAAAAPADAPGDAEAVALPVATAPVALPVGGGGSAGVRRSSSLVKSIPRPRRSAGGGMNFTRPAARAEAGTGTGDEVAEEAAGGVGALEATGGVGTLAPTTPILDGDEVQEGSGALLADAGPIGRRSGGMLASRAPAGPSGAAAPDPAERNLTGTPGQVIETEDVGSTVRIFRVGRPAGLSFRAGQYVKVGLPGARRGSFTIASAPHESHLELCIELIPGGRLTPRMFATSAGGRLDVGETAKGSFTLDESGTTHLMVATVTGIAPLRSMLRDALRKGTRDHFVVLHGASYADELPYRAELEGLAAIDERVSYTPTVSRPGEPRNAGWRGATGRVDELAAEVAATLPGATTRAYACGNPGMVDTVTQALRQRGLKVLTEKFD
jgi:NAD(P)H-flavin reductase